LGDKNESARIQRIDDVRSLYRRIFASNCFDRRAKKPFSLFLSSTTPEVHSMAVPPAAPKGSDGAPTLALLKALHLKVKRIGPVHLPPPRTLAVRTRARNKRLTNGAPLAEEKLCAVNQQTR
jgi:hypothetical protein